MALALSHRYRCSICGGRDCSWKAPSIQCNHPWLLLSYSSTSIDRLLRYLSFKCTRGIALNHETRTWNTTSTMSPPEDRLGTMFWHALHHGQDSTSRITGGNFLHVLLCNFGKTYPEVIYYFISELNNGDLISVCLGPCPRKVSNPPMLLQRDAHGNLPIHVASSVGLPMNLYLVLLRQTLEAQKSFWSGALLGSNATFTSEAVAQPAIFIPYLLSLNGNELSLLDIELVRFVDGNTDFVHSHGASYPVRNRQRKSLQTLRDAVTQMNTDNGRKIRFGCHADVIAAERHFHRSHPSVSNSFINRVKCIILAAYDELQWLLLRCRNHPSPRQAHQCTFDWFYCHGENVLMLLDWFPIFGCDRNAMTHEDKRLAVTDITNENPYALHYASALSGPTVICNEVDYNSKESHSFHETATYLLQISRPFLELLLLEENAVLACNLPHARTGQLPLHFAVQAGSVFCSNVNYCRSFYVGCLCEACCRNESFIHKWKEWIQKLIEIDPTTCSKKDFMNRTPLHYFLLRCFHHRCLCRKDMDELCYCFCRNNLDDSSVAFLYGKCCDDCHGYGHFPVCVLDENDRNEVVNLFIRSNPESIEIPCQIRYRTITVQTNECESMNSMPLVTIKSDYSCRFEVYQLAAMAYPAVSLNTLFSILRMCPSRCYRNHGYSKTNDIAVSSPNSSNIVNHG